MALEGQKYQKLNDPYLTPTDRDIAHGAEFHLNWNWIRMGNISLYSQNMLHFLQSSKDGRVKLGGWQYEQGLSLGKSLELFKYHHSIHIFEDTRNTHFPNQDYVGIRFIMLNRK
jgi:hypothetical protein